MEKKISKNAMIVQIHKAIYRKKTQYLINI